MANGQPEGQQKPPVTRPVGGWTFSRGFWLGMGTVGLFSGILLLAGAFAAGRGPEAAAPTGPTPTFEPVQVSYAPRPKKPRDNMTMAEGQSPAGAVTSLSAMEPAVSSLTVGAANGGASAAVSATSSSPTPVASSWSSTPVFAPPAPAPAMGAAALALAGDVERRFGIDIVVEGQDWGADEAEQTTNIGAVASAMEMIPLRVTSSIVTSPHGQLAVLSNRQGRTIEGWQPYGDSTRSFYTNSEQGALGYHAANEIVLATGSGPVTVAHEMIHAWTFREMAPDDYVLAMLRDEMRSFMAVAGWEQIASDDDVRASARESWDTVNGFFAYEGPQMPLVDENGYEGTFTAANPLEAIASLGAIYYARPAGMPLPAWPAIWAWFDANLG